MQNIINQYEIKNIEISLRISSYKVLKDEGSIYKYQIILVDILILQKISFLFIKVYSLKNINIYFYQNT